MDGTVLLKSQQANFIDRLNSGLESLLPYEKSGIYGEIKTISGQDLREIRQYCWLMVKKFIAFNNLEPKQIFINNMKGKLGEKIVEKCLGDLVNRVRYDIIIETGDGKIDLTYDADDTIGIQVKTRYSSVNQAQWWVSVDEIKKNKAIVCVLIHQDNVQFPEFEEFLIEYSPVMAGFLPTDLLQEMIDENEVEVNLKDGKSLVKLRIENLLHGSGLQSYLMSLTNNAEVYIKSGNICTKRGDYQEGIENYTKAIHIDPGCADAYRQRGIAKANIGNQQEANDDLLVASEVYLKQNNINAAQQVIAIMRDLQKAAPLPPPVSEWKFSRTLEGHYDAVFSFTTSLDSQILASGSKDKTIKLWNLHTGEIIQTLSGHLGAISCVKTSPDGEIIASGSADRTIKLWNFHTGELIQTLSGHSRYVNSLAFSPQGSSLASGSYDKTVKLWNFRTAELLNTPYQHTDVVFAVAFSPDGEMIASSSSDKKIIIYNLNGGKICSTYSISFYIRAIAISSDGQIIVSGSDDGKVQIWNLYSGDLIYTLTKHLKRVRSVAISPDGKILASGSDDMTIKLWNLHTGELIQTLSGHTGEVYSVAFISPDGKVLASSSADKTIKIWQRG